VVDSRGREYTGDMRKPSKPVLLAVAGVQAVSALVAWRDVSARPDSDVRGSKTFWRVFVLMNPGNSLAYWIVGRR
jgi:hypothetical protein